jgi:hypothetical protein
VKTFIKTTGLIGAGVIWMVATACLNPPVESPKTTTVQTTPIRVSQNAQNKVDILFMVDNSLSMDAMQAELQKRFPQFLQVFDCLAAGKGADCNTPGTPQYADLHIGVVTSDYGAGQSSTPGSGCTTSPGGQLGNLQKMGAKAAPGCNQPSDNYISFAYGAGGNTSNIGAATSQNLADTFTCMASVGSGGCGFEHQLESVYAAFKSATQNAGFLRDDALLTIVFVTNEDDGSAPPTSGFYDPNFDPNVLSYGNVGAYDTYRQTRYGIVCDGNLIPNAAAGPFGSCVSVDANTPVPNAQGVTKLEYPLQRYIDLFTKPKPIGIKADPANDLILVGIDGPDENVTLQTIQAASGSGGGVGQYPQYTTCQPLDPVNKSCTVRIQHTCQNNQQPAFFADPDIRLNTVIRKANIKTIASICGGDPNTPPDYTQVLAGVGQLIASSLKPGCIPAPLTDPANPQCSVADVTTTTDANGNAVSTSYEMCRCGDTKCSSQSGQKPFPCWDVQKSSACAGTSPDGVQIIINRNNVAVPPNTTARVECSTTAG